MTACLFAAATPWADRTCSVGSLSDNYRPRTLSNMS